MISLSNKNKFLWLNKLNCPLFRNFFTKIIGVICIKIKMLMVGDLLLIKIKLINSQKANLKLVFNRGNMKISLIEKKVALL